MNEVDTAVVYWNASTQFTDGAQFGLGAEIIDSTQKTIARGPVGLREITTYKWFVDGRGPNAALNWRRAPESGILGLAHLSRVSDPWPQSWFGSGR